MRVKLEDVCERGTSNLRQSDVEGRIGDYPIYGAAGYIGNVDFYHQEKPYVAVVKDGAGIGRTMFLPAKSSVIGTMQYLLPKDNIMPEYLCYVVRYMHLEKYFSGATIPHIYFRDYKNEEFNLDCLEKQSSVVDTLGRIEKIIDARQRELRILDDLIKARFVEMFGDLETNDNGYYKATLQELINEGYITYHLDGNHGSDYPRIEEFEESGVPYIGANCIVNDEIDFSLAKHLSEERASKLKKGIAINDDVLFAHNATVGPAVVLKTEETRVILSTSLTAFRCDKTRITPRYLRAYLLSDCFVKQYMLEMKQTTRNQVPITTQRKYWFVVPPIEEQIIFERIAVQIDKSKFAVQKAIDKAQLLFDSLMQQFFS